MSFRQAAIDRIAYLRGEAADDAAMRADDWYVQRTYRGLGNPARYGRKVAITVGDARHDAYLASLLDTLLVSLSYMPQGMAATVTMTVDLSENT